MSEKYFLTSDVHSYYDELIETLNEAGFDPKNHDHFLCILGDLFDRGPKSAEVLKFVTALGDNFLYIRGNHEDLLTQCIKEEILLSRVPSYYHFTNGTIRTISQLCGVSEVEFFHPRKSLIELVDKTMSPIVDWIDSKSLDYAVIDDYILVHGWVPTRHASRPLSGDTSGGSKILPVPMSKWDTIGEQEWSVARWSNGMEAWNQGGGIPGKTVCCGHWGTNYGWSHIRQERKEWPTKNRENWKKSFEPFIDNGIVALDSTVAYSGFLNCVVLE